MHLVLAHRSMNSEEVDVSGCEAISEIQALHYP